MSQNIVRDQYGNPITNDPHVFGLLVAWCCRRWRIYCQQQVRTCCDYPRRQRTLHGGFTRIELLVLLTCVGLLGALACSVIASGAARGDLVVCANNLRQVGRAFNMWASDHGNRKPWWVPHTEGGSLLPAEEPPIINVPGLGPVPAAVRNNAWMHFAFIADELRTPALLVCPADTGKLRAHDFSRNSIGGYLSAGFGDRATSYFIGLHAFEPFASALLSGDRTIQETYSDSFCSANVGNTYGIRRSGPYGWQPGVHAAAGNLLLNDGSVEELSASGLAEFQRTRMTDPSGTGQDHILKP